MDPSRVAEFDGSRDDLTSQCSEEEDSKSKKSGQSRKSNTKSVVSRSIKSIKSKLTNKKSSQFQK